MWKHIQKSAMTEQHKRNPCQPALDFDHNKLPGERNPAKQNLDIERSSKGQGGHCEKHGGKSTTGEKPFVRKENQKRQDCWGTGVRESVF